MAAKSSDAKAALRQLMKQEKQKRIDSPLAKYTNTGQLFCALCNQQLTSETFWKAHVNGRDHKQKLLELKSNIKQTNADQVFAKPFPPSPLTTPQQQQQRGVKRSHDVASANDPVTTSKPPATSASHSSLPADFFDTGASVETSKTITKAAAVVAPVQSATVTSSEAPTALPEGFFDDPQRDAMMRKVEYVDKMEVEWDAFTREMKQESHISDKLLANDDLEREVDREIKEATDLINRWQKIEEMHDLKEHRFKVKKESSKKAAKIEEDDDDDHEDADLEKELEGMYNWRQKRS